MAAPLPPRGRAYQPWARPWGGHGPRAPRSEGTLHPDAGRALASSTARRRSFKAHRFTSHPTQGVALGWRRPHRWRSPPAPHRGIPRQPGTALKATQGTRSEQRPRQRPRLLRPNGAKCDSPEQRPGSSVRKNPEPCRGALTPTPTASTGHDALGAFDNKRDSPNG